MPKYSWYEVDMRGHHQHATRLFDTEADARHHAALHSMNAKSPSWWYLFVVTYEDNPPVEVIDPEESTPYPEGTDE